MTRRLPFVFFFLSGFSGLLYQMVWLRLAFAHFGVLTPVLSVVISAFMLGLGAGSWLGGRWVDRGGVSESSVAWLVRYGIVEGSIGLWALLIPMLFQWGDRRLFGDGQMDSTAYLICSGTMLATILLPACVAMGMTYPVMMGFWRRRFDHPERSFSALYTANVAGAVLGALVTTYVFIECIGLRNTNFTGAGINLVIAVASVLWATLGRERSEAVDSVSDSSDTQPRERSLLAALVITGFSSMALEVLWTRLFTPVLGTTTYAFATVLSLYLFSLGVGALIYRTLIRRGISLSLPVMAGALALTAASVIPINDPRLHLGGVGIFLGLFPFCVLLGSFTPALVDRYSRGESAPAGRAYAANILGCVLGPLVASYALLPTMSVRWAVLSQAGVLLLLLPILPRKTRPWNWGLIVGSIALTVACAISESLDDRGASNETGIVHRDYAATVVSSGRGFQRHLYVNGIGITVLHPVTKIMAHLPILCHRGDVYSSLMICFGMGTTYRSLLSWGIDTTAVELVPSVPKAFGYYFNDAAQVLQNPKGHIVIDDGRRFLKRTSTRYDIITLDPPPPIEASASSLLYSPEFYTLVKSHLNPDGILQQWWPGGEKRTLFAVARALDESFPYVKVYHGLGERGFHFLASESPIDPPTIEAAVRRMPPDARKDVMEWVPPHGRLELALQNVFSLELSSDTFRSLANVDILNDDHPFNEYYVLRRWSDHWHHRLAWVS